MAEWRVVAGRLGRDPAAIRLIHPPLASQLGRPGPLAKLAAGLLQTGEPIWQPGLLPLGLGNVMLHASLMLRSCLRRARRLFVEPIEATSRKPTTRPSAAASASRVPWVWPVTVWLSTLTLPPRCSPAPRHPPRRRR
jgi:hypothetical protein